jgi:hypothetical protein
VAIYNDCIHSIVISIHTVSIRLQYVWSIFMYVIVLIRLRHIYGDSELRLGTYMDGYPIRNYYKVYSGAGT